jgi:Protein of unknown function (DUF3105)
MSSRREEKERRRQERIARERAEAESSRRRRVYSVVAGSVLSIAAVAAIVFAVAVGGGGGSSSSAGGSDKAKNTLPPPPQKTSSLAEAAKKAKCVLRSPVIEGRTHVTTPVKYKTNPPTSGNHYPIPQPDGVYTKPPALTHVVHTLEHGRIEIQYTPSLDPKWVRQLGGLFNEDPSYMLLFPNKTMPYEIAVTSWGQLAGCKKATDATFDVIRAFRQRYVGKSPEPLSTQPTNF